MEPGQGMLNMQCHRLLEKLYSCAEDSSNAFRVYKRSPSDEIGGQAKSTQTEARADNAAEEARQRDLNRWTPCHRGAPRRQHQ